MITSKYLLSLVLLYEIILGVETFINDFYRNHIFGSSRESKRNFFRIRSSRNNEIEDQVSSFILRGKHKYLGGAVDDDGNVYGIPSHSSEIVCMSPVTSESHKATYQLQTIKLPPSISKGKFKWLRGIIADSILYGIPSWSNSGILRVDLRRYWKNRNSDNLEEEILDDDVVTVIPVHYDSNVVNHMKLGSIHGMDQERRWQWHGAALNQNHTAIYCIPSNARSVLKVDIETKRTYLLPIPSSSTPLDQTNKWYGGILGDDACVYGIPYAASGVLRIDTNTDVVDIIGDFGVKEYHWHGGAISPKTGAIYAFPSHSSFVLKINTDPKCMMSQKLTLLPIDRAPHDTVDRYKWGGGGVGADGNVYGMPSDACSILKIDTDTDLISTFGFVGQDKNKWQGAQLASDGSLYAIPSNAESVLRLDTNTNCTGSYELIGNFSAVKDKWQGGLVGKDGSIVCIPENIDRILILHPRGNETDFELL